MSFNWLKRIFTSGLEKPSPSDFIQETGILLDNYSAKIIIDLHQNNIGLVKQPKVWIPSIPDTNSMDPGFDFGHNNILIAGADELDHKRLINFIKVGDIAVYRMTNLIDSPGDFSKPYSFYAIHRIVEIGKDSEGRYFRFQGDNNAVKDPYKARDKNILWVAIGVVF